MYSHLKSLAKNLFHDNLPAVLLFLITLYICFQNYVPNTFLTGWDTLHPEFNFGLYWQRILDGAWQEHQGLGAVATQAHASEITRVWFLQLLGLLFRLNQIRYFYAFIMLLLGPVGVYFFLKKILLKDLSDVSSGIGGFAGGLLYLLNLGTLQHFYVPLEMFLTHYGFLGWLFLYASLFFETGRRKYLLIFIILTLLSSSQAHTATLFYAYLLGLFAFFVVLSFASHVKGVTPWRLGLTRSFYIVFLTLIVNFFWFLPNTYFVLSHGQEITESKIHGLFSQEAFLTNKQYGSFQDLLLVRNFLFNWGEHTGQGQFGELLDEWKLHLKKPFVESLGYSFFAFSLLGAMYLLIKRDRYVWSVFGLFFVSVFFLMNVNPPFGFIFNFMQEYIPLFKEAFRFPFTKFSILFIFAYASLFGITVAAASRLFAGIKNRKLYRMVMLLLYLAVFNSLVYYMQPVFKGYLISPSMKVNIPQRYFDLFDYFDRQEDYGRVAHLPLHSFWGWIYDNWDFRTKLGYQGAGFLWFGIKQPLLDREFDRWNLMNEQQYKEMSYAVYSRDPKLLISVMDKYKIKWLLLDESEMAVGADPKELFYPEIKSMIASIPEVSLDKDFGSGLKVYKYSKNFSRVEKLTTFYETSDHIFKEQTDPIFPFTGNYVEKGNKSYPFLGITKFDETINPEFVQAGNTSVSLKMDSGLYEVSKASVDTLPIDFEATYQAGSLNLSFQSIGLQDPLTASTSITTALESGSTYLIEINNQLIDLSEITSGGTVVKTLLLDPQKPIVLKLYGEDKTQYQVLNVASNLEVCSDVDSFSSYSYEKIDGGFRLKARKSMACLTSNLAAVFQNLAQGSLIKLYVEKDQVSPKICVFNEESGLCDNVLLNSNDYTFITDLPYKYNIRFFSDGRGSDAEHSEDYKNIGLTTMPLIADATLNFSNTQADVYKVNNVGKNVFSFTKEPGFYGNAVNLQDFPVSCKGGMGDLGKSYVQKTDSYIRYGMEDEPICDSFGFPSAQHQFGYILEVTSRNIEGMPLRMCLTNEYSKKCDLYVSLPNSPDFVDSVYFIPPMGATKGYTLNFSALDIGKQTSVNDLKYVALTPFPFKTATSLHKPLTEVKDNLVVLNEAYETGWTAFCGLSRCPAEHVKVNNWANGWVFEKGVNTNEIRFFFMPQLSEYFGFFIVAVVFWFTFRKARSYGLEPEPTD